MPSTPIYDFPFESPFGDQPGITLHGGNPPSSDILAEEVEVELNRVENSVVAGIDARLTAVEAALAVSRWRTIATATTSGATVNIPVPAGYQRLRLTLDGDLDAVGNVNLRLNGDTSTSYIRQFLAWDGAGVQDNAEYNATGTGIKIAEWATVESNGVVVEIFPTDGSFAPTFIAMGSRIATLATAQQTQFAVGRYGHDAVVTDVNLDVSNGATTFADLRYWLEGWLS